MEEEEIGQEFDRVIRAGMMATSNVTDAIARRSAEQARVQREAALTEARAADVATKRAEQLAREAAHDGRALELANIRATQATEAEKNRLTREALQVTDRSIDRDEWWKNATPTRIADTVSLAAGASEKSPLAVSVYERMSGKIQDLYGIELQEYRAMYTMPFAPNQELNRHSALVDAIDDTLARRREEAEAANARSEAADATKEAAADTNSAYSQYADREWLENASRDQLSEAYAQTAGAAESDQTAFVANGRIADALDARFGVVQVIDKTGTPEDIKAETSRAIDAAAVGEESPQYGDNVGTDAGTQRAQAAAAGVRAEQHEDAASEHHRAEGTNLVKAAAAAPQTSAARTVSESFPDTIQQSLRKAPKPAAVKARVARGVGSDRVPEQAIER